MQPKSSTVVVSPSFAPSRQIERRFGAHLSVCAEKSASVVEDQPADSRGDWRGLPLSRQSSTRFSDPSFPSRTRLFGRGRLIPFAFEHRQPGILRESRIRRRQLAQPKNRVPIRLNSACMYAIRAKPHAPRLMVFRHVPRIARAARPSPSPESSVPRSQRFCSRSMVGITGPQLSRGMTSRPRQNTKGIL